MTVKIGYVGLGAMGGALARRLVDRYPLVVWDMNRGAIDDLVAAGATTAATLTELARQCDIVFLCLPRSSDVASVLFDPGGWRMECLRARSWSIKRAGFPRRRPSSLADWRYRASA
jgi:3-hydroxyisobutyrate dehydrogenase-like beta-hydroxyacid dehydrogenase